jgi:SAM-dependent methyltransferase
MDHLEKVLAEICRCLKPGGSLLCSVPTDRIIQWSLLPNLVAMAGFDSQAASLQNDFVTYHHFVNLLSVQEWQMKFTNAGLIPEDHISILPEFNSGIALLMDALWHVKCPAGGEMGDTFFPFLAANPNFPSAFRSMLAGLLDMETDWQDGSGAVFLAKKEG